LYRRGSRDGDSYGYVDDMRKSAAAAWATPLGHDGGHLRKESPPASGLPLTVVVCFTEGYAYSRSSSFSAARSPDTASPIYPERAIRPLPNRRLKSRLSPEQQSSIIYPPDPPPMSPTLNFHAQENGGRGMSNGDLEHDHEHDHDHDHDHHHHHHEAISVHDHCTCNHDEGDSGDDEVEFDHPDHRYATMGPLAVNGKAPLDSVQRRLMEASRGGKPVGAPGSVTSSADGYESFENTSNKKKRKIPLSSASSMHQSSLSAEMASMGISNMDGAADEYSHAQRPHHAAPGSSPSGTGISGAGRGRYGRQNGRDSRRPLGNNTTNANGYGPRAPARSVSSGEVRSIGKSGSSSSLNLRAEHIHNQDISLTLARFIIRHRSGTYWRHHFTGNQNCRGTRTSYPSKGQGERQSPATICISLRHPQDPIHLHLRIR
jgi:hypothetical protein